MGKYLSFTVAVILQALDNGYQYGFDIMDVTGLPSGTVYPALRRLEEAGYVDSKWEKHTIAQAAQRYFADHPERVNGAPLPPHAFDPYLAMSYAPEPDLFIRTGGEQRISNFLLWQLAYTELYFTESLWPDFDGAALDQAIASYRNRERRFGRTSEQLEEAKRSEVA